MIPLRSAKTPGQGHDHQRHGINEGLLNQECHAPSPPFSASEVEGGFPPPSGGCNGYGALALTLSPPADEHLNHQGEGAEVDDGGDDDVGDVLVVGRQIGQLEAGDVQHRHEAASKDDGDGVVDGQQGHGNAVKPVDGRDW